MSILSEYTGDGQALDGYQVQHGDPGGLFVCPIVSVVCDAPSAALSRTDHVAVRHALLIRTIVDRAVREDSWVEARRAQAEIAAAMESRRTSFHGIGALTMDTAPPEPDEDQPHLHVGTIALRDRFEYASEEVTG